MRGSRIKRKGLSQGSQCEPTRGGMPLLKSYIEFAGIHSDLFFASEGTASPNSTSALMTGRLRQVGFRAAGAAALIPSSAQKRSGSSSRSFKAIFKRGMPRTLRMIPDAGCRDLFIFRGHKNRAPKSPVFLLPECFIQHQQSQMLRIRD